MKKCHKRCIECDPTDPKKCFKCKEGYTARLNGKCDKCLGSCSGYCDPLDINKCLKCADGFQLVNNECKRCKTGCSSCYADQCVDCFPGFELDVVNNNVVCSQKCR